MALMALIGASVIGVVCAMIAWFFGAGLSLSVLVYASVCLSLVAFTVLRLFAGRAPAAEHLACEIEADLMALHEAAAHVGRRFERSV